MNQFWCVAVICIVFCCCCLLVQSESERKLHEQFDSLIIHNNEDVTLDVERLHVSNDLVVRDGGKLTITGSICTIGGAIIVEHGGRLAMNDSYIEMGCLIEVAGVLELTKVMWLKGEGKNPPYITMVGNSTLSIEQSDIRGSDGVPEIGGHCDTIRLVECQIKTNNGSPFVFIASKKCVVADNVIEIYAKEVTANSEVRRRTNVFDVKADEIEISGNRITAWGVCNTMFELVSSNKVSVSGNDIRMRVTGAERFWSIVSCKSPLISITDNSVWGGGYLSCITAKGTGDVHVLRNRAIGGYDMFAVFVISAVMCNVVDNYVLGALGCDFVVYVTGRRAIIQRNEFVECTVNSVIHASSGVAAVSKNVFKHCDGVRYGYEIRNPYNLRVEKEWSKSGYAWDLVVISHPDNGETCDVSDNTVVQCKTMRVCLVLGGEDADMGVYIKQIMTWSLTRSTIDVIIELNSKWNDDLAIEAYTLLSPGNNVEKSVGWSRHNIRGLMRE